MSLSTDFTEVWAVPGANHIIDTINPITGLTSVYGKDAHAVLTENPNAVRMTWEVWRTAAAERQQTPITWQRTTARKYQEMLEVLPPAYWSGGAFLVGEPYDHDFATGAPRFQAYVQRGDYYFVASRPLTLKELKAELGR